MKKSLFIIASAFYFPRTMQNTLANIVLVFLAFRAVGTTIFINKHFNISGISKF